MKILIVAATKMEVKLLVDEMDLVEEKSHILKEFRLGTLTVDFLITGIGTTFTTFHLTNTLKENSYDLVLNVGIAGSLVKEYTIGEVVNVVSEEFADLGIEKENEFLTLFETGFIDSNEFPFQQGVLKASNSNELIEIRKVRGITTNVSHEKGSSIAKIHEKFSAQIVTAEGSAIFYVCSWMGIPCYQIRAISNYVESKNLSQWNIPLALENLKNIVLETLRKFDLPVA